MNAAFIDTAYLIALLFADDAFHGRAVEYHQMDVGQLVTTEYVLFEFADGMCSTRHRRLVQPTFAALRQDPRIEIIPASRELVSRAEDLFNSRADKEWSLTDCSSFVIMQALGISDALTSDHHFVQAGFRALLRTPLT